MEDSQVAAAVSAQLAERIGQQRFDLWFKLQARIRTRGSTLTIQATNGFVRDWLRSHFADEIEACWQSVVGSGGEVEFELASQLASPVVAPTRIDASPTVRAAARRVEPATSRSNAAAHSAPAEPSVPGRKISLASFVIGASNEYAYRAAELTARGRQQASPLLLVGPTGVGKTHLLRGILQDYRRSHARAAALYLTAEQFTSSFVEAIRGSGLPSFRQKCRGVQLLAIDDLQFFAGKQRTLEELLYTLDTITNDGRQVVLASDRGLGELRSLGAELVSRLAGGLTCELATPEFATRLGIVQRLAGEAGVALGDDVATLLATQITSGARELRGVFHRVQAMSAAYGQPVTRELAERGLAELARHHTRALRLADVQKVVCDAFGVEPAQLRSDRKGRAVAQPRMLAMWLARKYTRAAWSEIGEFFGRSSHSTAISAHRRVEKLIAQQAQIGIADQACHVDEAIRRLESALRTA